MNASIEYQENCSVDLDINRIDSSCFNCVLVYRKTINRHPVCLLCWFVFSAGHKRADSNYA